MGTLPSTGPSISMVAIPTNIAIVSDGAGEDGFLSDPRGSRHSSISEQKHQIANKSGARRIDLP
jgi:hypothetical protein